jgi:restriction endonuclease S subunit
MSKLSAEEKRSQQNARLIAAMGLLFGKLQGDGVPTRRLHEIASTGSGGTPSRHNPTFFGGTIPWIKSGDLTDGLINKVDEFITDDGLNNSAARVFPAGTIVVALYGATVGKTGILAYPAASNQAVCAVVPRDESVVSRYIFWFLRYKRRDFLDQSFGGAQPNISQSLLRSVIIPVPPRHVQQAVVSFLDSVEQRQQGQHSDFPSLPSPLTEQRRLVERIDALAAKIEEAKKLFEQTEHGLLELCRSILRSQGDGQIQLTPMNELVRQREPDVSVHQDQTYHFAGIYCFGGGVFVGQRKTGLEFKYPRLTTLRTNNFVYPKLMAWEGALAVVPPNCDGLVVSTEYPVFEINQDKVLPEVLDVYFRTPSVWPALSGSSSGTNVRRRRLNPIDFLRYKFPLPSRATQEKLRLIKCKVDEANASRDLERKKLDAMLPAILDWAFRGGLQ